MSDQLRHNRQAAENEIKIKKQQLLLEIERLYEIAMKDIDIQVKLKSDKIEDRMHEYREIMRECDQAKDMITLKVKGQSMQKFVKEYLQTVKEGENVLKREVKVDPQFEQTVLDIRVKAPYFNYVIGQRNHRGEVMSVGMMMASNQSF